MSPKSSVDDGVIIGRLVDEEVEGGTGEGGVAVTLTLKTALESI